MDEKKLKKIFNNGNFFNINSYLISNYIHLGMNSEDFIVFLQIQNFKLENNLMPTSEELSLKTNFSIKTIETILNKMVEKKFLNIDLKNGEYDFTPFYSFVLNGERKEIIPNEKNKKSIKNNLIQEIELEINRTISPFEIEKIISWTDDDNFNPEIIILAVKEAVYNGAPSINYINKILFNWKKSGLNTIKQVKDSIDERHKLNNLELKNKNIEFPSGLLHKKNTP